MGADLPDEAGEPPDGHADRQDDQPGSGARAARANGIPPETRGREEYYADLHKAVSKKESITAQQAAAGEQAAVEKWNAQAGESRWMWGEYQRRWLPSERAPANSSEASPGSWRGEGDRKLDAAANSRVDAACDRIAKLEEQKITPALRAVESQDPDRHLVGLENCRKGRDRIKEKAADRMKEKNRTPEEAVSLIPDTLRYTFQYSEARYTQGVWAEIGRLKSQGFEERIRRNYWSDEQYKGINSQWVEPDSGQRLEVQFHTRISFEAKQLTHEAYERLRTKQADKFEELVLEAFQKKVAAEVPIPRGATDIPDYP